MTVLYRPRPDKHECGPGWSYNDGHGAYWPTVEKGDRWICDEDGTSSGNEPCGRVWICTSGTKYSGGSGGAKWKPLRWWRIPLRDLRWRTGE